MKLRAFATDGESELIKAFGLTFPEAAHLRCTNHLCQNIKDKLRALSIPQEAWKEFLADIFGAQAGSHFEMGLVNAESESSFGRLYVASKNVGTICVLPSVRAKAGLVDPRLHFTTNNTSEALNNIIKQEMNWKERSYPC